MALHDPELARGSCVACLATWYILCSTSEQNNVGQFFQMEILQYFLECTEVTNVCIIEGGLFQVIGTTHSLNRRVQIVRVLEWDIFPFLESNGLSSHYYSLGLISSLD